MSTDRVIVDPNGRRFGAHSMDRFGDDLCELCVSYLEFGDKTAFECLSKQFFRTVHWRQTQLCIHAIRDEAKRDKQEFYYWAYDCNSYAVPFVLRDRPDDSTRLECLLKKYPNIESIVLRDVCIERTVAEVLAKCCRQLTTLWIRGSDLTDEAIDVFGQRCGRRIRKIHLDSCYSYNFGYFSSNKFLEQKLLAYCPNIESFYSENFWVFSEKPIDFLPKLQSLEIEINLSNASLFTEFCNKYGKQLKTLKISTANWDSNYGITTRQMINILANISRLRAVEELDLSFFSITDRVNEKIINIDQQLHEIGINCPKIRRFSLSLDYYLKLDGNVFKSFATFQSLKHFEISFEITNIKQSVADIGLKKNMTTLIIHSHQIGDQFFDDIHKFAPNLKTFDLTTRLSDISDNLLMSVSKLANLEVLSLRRLRSGLKNITDSGVHRLLNNCCSLKRINLSFRTSITNKTIENLISKALKRPKQVLKLETTNYDPNKEIDIQVIDLSLLGDSIPDNLFIKID